MPETAPAARHLAAPARAWERGGPAVPLSPGLLAAVLLAHGAGAVALAERLSAPPEPLRATVLAVRWLPPEAVAEARSGDAAASPETTETLPPPPVEPDPRPVPEPAPEPTSLAPAPMVTTAAPSARTEVPSLPRKPEPKAKGKALKPKPARAQTKKPKSEPRPTSTTAQRPALPAPKEPRPHPPVPSAGPPAAKPAGTAGGARTQAGGGAAKPSGKSASPPSWRASYLHNPAPAYPEEARRRGDEGRLTLRVRVSPAGLATEVRIQSGSGSPALDRAALAAVKRWRFVPARTGGQAVAAWVLVPISFSLRR